LPTIYPLRVFVNDGGLIYYGIDFPEMFRGAASYVDRILRGAKPDQLPVQQPSKFELIINLKAAKALGLDVPLHLQQLADELIERSPHGFRYWHLTPFTPLQKCGRYRINSGQTAATGLTSFAAEDPSRSSEPEKRDCVHRSTA
jgi:hypothetical protein